MAKSSDHSSSPSPSRKRKRQDKTLDEIEVNIAAPEPPSKKAVRRAKKAKLTPTIKHSGDASKDNSVAVKATAAATDEKENTQSSAPSQRQAPGIWIGNLPWSVTKADLRKFLTEKTSITDDMITRLHMPLPSGATLASSRQKMKPQNKGFAYVDFSTEKALVEAIGLSETLLTGRSVLIKDSKSFEGRPDKVTTKDDSGVSPANSNGKTPSKRVFLGNLAFDTTRDELQDHFTKCGEVADVHVATFEDSGKCKGYAWIEFQELEGAEAAVRGWVDLIVDEDGEEDEDDKVEGPGKSETQEVSKAKKPKFRKWWVNRIKGRPLRMEFAEDKAVRYKKRFGKDASGRERKDGYQVEVKDGDVNVVVDSRPDSSHPDKVRVGSEQGYRKKDNKVDARTTKPGAAPVNVQRLTGAIVESKGKKTTFDG